ncbi:4'-phosphopantetheinyl transferase superfamily protein [Streptomyces sp. NPDC047028]|uniref:4'-phosphopantetheinyl transferase family protein n=1 Tax=Streptomyces sp. NPDC047028 TaxID=3155793 RepID=UPI0033CC27E0
MEVLPDPADGPHVWLVTPGAGGSGRDDDADARVLDAVESRRAARLRDPVVRGGYVAAHAALRRLLGAYLGIPAARVPLVRLPCPRCGLPHGRPAPVGSGPQFSLSRAGALSMLAVASAPVGVDLERIAGPRVAEDASGILHPADRADLAALPPARRPAAFTRCWTRLEAVAKAGGEGLSLTEAGAPRLGTTAVPEPVTGWLVTDVPAPPGYAAACAMRS